MDTVGQTISVTVPNNNAANQRRADARNPERICAECALAAFACSAGTLR
jgi:hypothetical protein